MVELGAGLALRTRSNQESTVLTLPRERVRRGTTVAVIVLYLPRRMTDRYPIC